MQLLREECISKLAEKYTSIHMPEINLPEFDGDFVCKSNNYVVVKLIVIQVINEELIESLRFQA